MIKLVENADALANSRLDRIRSIESVIVRIPTIREHRLSSLSVTYQSYVLVRLKSDDGVEGIGEAATLGGPRWAEEAVETIKAVIDTYLAPALIGHPIDEIRSARSVMDKVAKRNNAAKSAIETAMFDALGKRLGVPISTLLGGATRKFVPVLWALASGDPQQEVDEAISMVEMRRHREFKIKIGALSPTEDLTRLEKVVRGLEGYGHLKVVDANQAWDEVTADRFIPALEELGIGLLEQPLPDWNVEGMARLAARHELPILADESVFTPHDAARIGKLAAADAVSLKLVKSGGFYSMQDVAAVSQANGLGLYGGCLLESTVGTAAHLHVYGSLPELRWGTESFGPLILKVDIVVEPLSYHDFGVQIPEGPGLGIALDEDKVRFFSQREGA